MKIFVVIDTNVLVSALLSKHRDSATAIILDNLFGDNIIPLYNDDILKEYRDVLHRAKFGFLDGDVKLVLSAIIGISSNRVLAKEIVQDPKDIVFYEVALSKDGAFLVTGNIKHFPKKPIVVTPAEFLSIIKKHQG